MSSSFRPPPGSIVLAWKCWSGLGQRGLLEAVRSGLRAVQSTCWCVRCALVCAAGVHCG